MNTSTRQARRIRQSADSVSLQRRTAHANHVFGPVPSRRLSRSLGIDLVPFKTCSYDCIYCQLGRTTCRTVERKEWVSMDAVLEELKQKIASQPDYITLSGSGEPTLHSRLGEIIERIQAMTAVPVAVLTNGSLLWRKDVREELALADVVLPSLDAPDPERFEFINRPHPEVTFVRLVEGLEAFRREFSGQYWLEVMLLNGYTTLPPQIRQFADWARRIHPDKVQLNTAVRPPAEEYAMAVTTERLDEIAQMFEPAAEAIAGYHRPGIHLASDASRPAILELLRRRPCTEKDLADGLVMNPIEVAKHLSVLEAAGSVASRRHGSLVYYHVARGVPFPSREVDAVSGERRRSCGSIESVPAVPRAGGVSPHKLSSRRGKKL